MAEQNEPLSAVRDEEIQVESFSATGGEVISEALADDQSKEAIKKATASPDEAVHLENATATILMLEKMHSDKKYAEDLESYYKKLAEKAGINTAKGAKNDPAVFMAADLNQVNFNQQELEKIAPITYKDLFAEFMSEEETKKKLLDMGIKAEGEDLKALTRSAQTAHAYHTKYGDSDVDYFKALESQVGTINGALSKREGTGRKFAMMAVMAVATGGTSLAVKGALTAVTHPKTVGVLKRAAEGFRNHLENAGVNLKPYDKAKEYSAAKVEAAKSKLSKSKAGLAILAGASLAGYATYGAITGDWDLEAATKAGVDLYNSIDLEGFKAGMESGNFEVSGGNPLVEPEVGASGSTGDATGLENPGAKDATGLSPEAAFFQANPEMVKMAQLQGVSPSDFYANHVEEINAAKDADFTSTTPVEVPTETLTVEKGGSIYGSVHDHLEAKLGMAPSPQVVMQMTSDILNEHGITKLSQVPPGFEFTIPADPEQYTHTNFVSQEVVDRVRNLDAAPASNSAAQQFEEFAKDFVAQSDAYNNLKTGDFSSFGPTASEGNPGAITADVKDHLRKFADHPNSPRGQ